LRKKKESVGKITRFVYSISVIHWFKVDFIDDFQKNKSRN